MSLLLNAETQACLLDSLRHDAASPKAKRAAGDQESLTHTSPMHAILHRRFSMTAVCGRVDQVSTIPLPEPGDETPTHSHHARHEKSCNASASTRESIPKQIVYKRYGEIIEQRRGGSGSPNIKQTSTPFDFQHLPCGLKCLLGFLRGLLPSYMAC